MRGKINKLKCSDWLFAIASDRVITIERDENALEQIALLDGCYVIKSDVPKENAEAKILHDRYCDLENVERTFRTMKSVHLELRPIFVRKEENTKGHAFVVMLALLLQRELEACWTDLDITVKEGIDELTSIRMEEIHMEGTSIQNIPRPDMLGKQLLKRAGITLPSMLPTRTTNVHTKKKLPSERIR